MKEQKTVSIAKDFTPFPTGRYREDGVGSGAEFRDDYLVPALENYKYVKVVFDDVAGLGSSFLDEVFGGLVRGKRWKLEYLNSHLELLTTQRELDDYITLAHQYMEKATQN